MNNFLEKTGSRKNGHPPEGYGREMPARFFLTLLFLLKMFYRWMRTKRT